MSSLKRLSVIFSHKLTKHILFWIGVYAYFIGTANLSYYSGYAEIIENYAIYIFCQVVIAYTCLYVLIPHFLNSKKQYIFIASLLVLWTVLFIIFIGYHEFFHMPRYYNPGDNSIYDSEKIFWKKLFNIRIFFGKFLLNITPAILLVTAKFYREQQAYLELKEQKTATELTALKHQLNPHFLFNTLNNLYALSLKKSNETPEVIAKLSEILDYMLYGCNDKYVSLKKEIELIENYLALEKVRYDERVDIGFTKNVVSNVKIAPLILLTFIENAFKHGVSQELKKASIQINISVKEEFIWFTITNSKVKNIVPLQKETIGLTNVKKTVIFIISRPVCFRY